MFSCFAAGLVLLMAAEAPNPCTNGSFEELTPEGRPADWDVAVPVHGQIIEAGAHSGRRCLRMVRPANAPYPETVLNRAWVPKNGQQGAMIDCVKGGIVFWYQALAASNDNLLVMAIPMNDTAFEEVSASRSEFVVPREHVGDGQWHEGKLKYDYGANPKVKWVHFAARILGGAGEMLLDDFAYVPSIGPLLRIEAPRLDEDADRPGERCTVNVLVVNKGDVAVRNLQLRIETPPGFAVDNPDYSLPELAPDGRLKHAWTVEGAREQAAAFSIRAFAEGAEAKNEARFAPELVLESFGPASPVVPASQSAALECYVRNSGHAIVRKPAAAFRLGPATVVVEGDDVAPGKISLLRAEFPAEAESPELACGVTLSAANAGAPISREAALVIGTASPLPAPAERISATTSDSLALLENEYVRLAFRKNSFGFGPGEILVKTANGWRTAAWMPRLSTLVYRDNAGRHGEFAFRSATPEGAADAIVFRSSEKDAGGAVWRGTFAFALEPGARQVRATYAIECGGARELLRFDGPMLYALDRDEAVFPGVEWLIEDELSSGTLDIEAGHPHQVRYVPHPNMITIPVMGVHGASGTVGLLWDCRAAWDGHRDRPAAVFASPDRFNGQRAHLMGLQLPSVPEFLEPNAREAVKPYPMQPGQPLRLQSWLLADAEGRDALSAMDAWFGRFGVIEPAPFPRGTLEGEIQFAMHAYLESLWDKDARQWWTTKNGHPLMAYRARPTAYAADLLLGATLAPDAALRERCRVFANEMAVEMNVEPRIEPLLYPGTDCFGLGDDAAFAGLLATRADDGLWRFDADLEDSGVFKGFDYHALGPDNAVALGTCADKMRLIMRQVRMTGAWDLYDAAENVLEYMAACKVPRAAQVWEVPFHSPDILASAYAVEAFMEAYQFTGETRWRDAARNEARRGLPFVYFWDDPEKPFLRGASIPVLGASLMKYSWFGRPVQWNGLCFANALLRLSEADDSYPWRRIATSLIASATYQQAADGEDAALWPDSIGAFDADKSAWVFSPRQILIGIEKLLGRDEEPRTKILGEGRERIHVNATGQIAHATWNDATVSFDLTYPDGRDGNAVLANLTRPTRVLVDGTQAPPDAAWRYIQDHAVLVIRISGSGTHRVSIEGARFRRIERLAPLAAAPDFSFDDGLEGWTPLHDVENLRIENHAMEADITGPDPYIARAGTKFNGTQYPILEIRMQVSAGRAAQFYWATTAAPGFTEDRVALFDIIPGEDFHEYRLDLSANPQWNDQTITSLRIDPENAAPKATFAIDYLHPAQ